MQYKEELITAENMGNSYQPVSTVKKTIITPSEPEILQPYPNSKTVFHKINPVVVDESDDLVLEEDDCIKTDMTISLNLEQYAAMEE